MKSNKFLKLINISLALILLLIVIPLISAQPPLSTIINLERGVDIIHPETQIIKIGEDLEINFWTHNSSDGETLTNSSLNCTYYLINNQGFNILKGSNINDSGFLIKYGKGLPLCINCWTAIISKGNFTTPSTYSYKIKCQGTNIGGYETGKFEVTPTGGQLDTSNSIIFGFMFMIIFIFLGFGVYGLIRSKKVEWTIFYICLTYLMAFCMFFVAWLFSDNYLWQTPILASVFWIIWLILAICFFPFIIGVSGYILKLQAEALMVSEYVDQGYSPQDAKSLTKARRKK